ncbi:hypothetical protein CQ054_20095 [Ochrobactrum sp. MYb29]|nr:hypothetical protein CQ054_20095 [Ochrobactrum sp. MYb29]
MPDKHHLAGAVSVLFLKHQKGVGTWKPLQQAFSKPFYCWQYSAQGSASIEPSSVYDNGKMTTFTFDGNAEIPAIYIQNSDGTESLVPKSVDGNMVMVHALSRKFTLRRGKDTLCVFNEAFSPQGINPETSTTSPSVERVVRTKVKVTDR